MSWRSGFAVGIGLARLLAVGCLLGLGGYRWVLGSYWHNVGMLGYREAVGVLVGADRWRDVAENLRLASASQGNVHPPALIQYRLAAALKRFAPEQADVLARSVLSSTFAGQPCIDTRISPYRRLLAGTFQANSFEFGRLSLWWPESGGGPRPKLSYYEGADGRCWARLVASFTPQNGRYVILYRGLSAKVGVTYRVTATVRNQGVTAYLADRRVWQGGNVRIPNSGVWQQVMYTFVADAVGNRVQFAITGGDGLLEIANVVLEELE